MKNNKPTAIDLFSGAGGLSEGFIQAGFHIVASVEADPIAAKTQSINHAYYKQYRTEIVTEDLQYTSAVAQKLKRKGIYDVDVIIGGPPCKGFSRANMMTRNASNTSNDLVRKFVKLVATIKPLVAVMENVADIEKFDNGKFADKIMNSFNAIGYKVEREVLNAVEFGVPQRRRRVFFIATRNGIPIIFPDPNISKESYVTVWEAISDLPNLKNGNRIDELPYKTTRNLSKYQKYMRSKKNDKVANNLVSHNGDLVLQRYRHIPQGGNWEYIPDKLMKNYYDKSRCHHWIYLRLKEDEPSVAITHYRKSMLIHPREDRGLSVREAARIQSFPDHFVFYGSISFQQQQVANAVPPRLAKAVAKSVRNILGK